LGEVFSEYPLTNTAKAIYLALERRYDGIGRRGIFVLSGGIGTGHSVERKSLLPEYLLSMLVPLFSERSGPRGRREVPTRSEVEWILR